MSRSIISQARDEGYQEGLDDAKHHYAQVNMCTYDEAYDKGKAAAELEYPRRRFWFACGNALPVLGYGIYKLFW